MNLPGSFSPKLKYNTGATAAAPVLILVPLALAGSNFVLAIYAIMVLAFAITLLWRPAEPPILLFIFIYQWIQAATGLFYGNMFDLRLNDIAQHLGKHDLACFLELTGLLFLALGMRITLGHPNYNLNDRIRTFVTSRPSGFWLRVYIGAWLFGAFCGSIAWGSGGLLQPLLTLSQIKWAGYAMLTFATFSIPGRSKGAWIAVSIFEFVLSIGGYFSSFKEVFFYAIIAVLGSGIKIKPSSFIVMIVAGFSLLSLGVVWTSVKRDYRDFVNQGNNEQVVNVGYNERVGYLAKLIGDLDAQSIERGVDTLARRTMYFEYFGAAAANVPENVPHTGGKIWGGAVLRSFMPRLIFSDKLPVHDSELTRQYTGLRVMSYEQGTSISMGYIAEAYIDFGPILMFLPMTLLGCLFGFIYRWLVSAPGRDGVLGAALAIFTLMPAYAIESSALKMIPGVLLCVAASIVVLKFIAPLIWGVQRKQAVFAPVR